MRWSGGLRLGTPLRVPVARHGSSSAGGAQPREGAASHAFADSLKLPLTAFPLRAEPAKREKLFRERTTTSLYRWQTAQRDRPLFILHDGPPYANGPLHIGHALNKILKDIILRSKLLLGHRVHYLPGWDTHGLPLELKALSALKLPASQLTPQEIRSAARKEAEKGVHGQREEFKQFGGLGEWAGWKTMDWKYEKRQLSVVKEMVKKGLITHHDKPTLYSPSSRTALAESEIEYIDNHPSRSVYVAFPIHDMGNLSSTLRDHIDSSVPISLGVWTTTPWTLPANIAIAVSTSITYALVQSLKTAWTTEYLIVAADRVEALEIILETSFKTITTFPGSDLLNTTYTSCLSTHTANSPDSTGSTAPPTESLLPRPVIKASYVTSTSGTGLVHTAPAHGVEDYEAWRDYNAQRAEDSSLSVLPKVPCIVDSLGQYSSLVKSVLPDQVELGEALVGKSVLKEGNAEVIKFMQAGIDARQERFDAGDRRGGNGGLLMEVPEHHRVAVDWRTKKPVIFRATNQWFANLDPIKADAVASLEKVDFHPHAGKKRLESYVNGRSEWCISRQRSWGVPLPVLYSSLSVSDSSASTSAPPVEETPHMTPSSIDHIISVLEIANADSPDAQGTDHWFSLPAEAFVEPHILAQSALEGRTWRKGTDTLDVWFDSGVSWSMFSELDLRPGPTAAATGQPWSDVVLEGSDQFRGWFQSSLLTAISAAPAPTSSSIDGDRPAAPYGTVITHGMVLDESGRKMSKSLGNVISPLVVISGGKNLKAQPAYGADLLRLWVASVDSSRDVPIGPQILAQTFEALRKIRGTARFMLGNLSENRVERAVVLSVAEREDLGLIERYVLSELYQLATNARDAYNSYAFNRVYQNLVTFTNTTLSAFYFDIIKDSLYADSTTTSAKRRKIIWTLQKILKTYMTVLAPIAPHLAEEIQYYSSGATSDPEDPDSREQRESSFFEQVWDVPDTAMYDSVAVKEMEELMITRNEVMRLMETARVSKQIGGSIEVAVEIYCNDKENALWKHRILLKDLFIVSAVEVLPIGTVAELSDLMPWSHSSSVATPGSSSNVTIRIVPASKSKCPRCWTFAREEQDEVCGRCSVVLKE